VGRGPTERGRAEPAEDPCHLADSGPVHLVTLRDPWRAVSLPRRGRDR